jgi:cytoskeletal protein RodZ
VSLRDIAETTKLSVSNLHALENNRITQLPGGIYRRAIVRAYAGHVGLDPETTLRAFLMQYPDDVPSWAELVPPQREWTLRSVALTILGAISALGR